MEKTLERSEYSVLGTGKKLDTGLPVLLKFWPTARPATAEDQERIRAEVAALQQVQHPHLLPLLEVCTSAQGVLLVSAPASSGSLDIHLQQQFPKQLPVEEALQVIQQVGLALHALHQQNLVHGNLMPHAVFFTAPGHVRLGNFRVKSILESIENYQAALEEGVPRCWYMAPEEFQGISHAESDQYALGCLAYFLLTGQVPFAGSARATLFQKHHRDLPTPLFEHNPAIPQFVEAVLFKALAKQPSDRYSSVQEFLHALQRAYGTDIVEQDTLAHSFNTTFVEQEEEPQPPFEEAWEASVSVLPEQEEIPSTTVIGSATAWTRTRVSGVTPAVLAVPSGKRQPASQSLRIRGFFVFLAVISLVLVTIFVSSRWFFSSSEPVQSQQSSVLTTPTGGHLSATATSTSAGRDPSPSPSPSPTLLPSPTATILPASTPTNGGLAAVMPLLDCVASTGNLLVAHFGYLNKNTFVVTIPLGAKNAVSPSSLDGSQPTSFTPGSQHEVFQLTFSRHQSVTWLLNGSAVTASATSPRC